MDSSTPGMVSSMGEVHFPENMTTIVIDHHVSNNEFGKMNLIEPDYIACCEIIYNLLKQWKIEITKDMAMCLMLGLYSDSGGFKYPRTNEQTFLAAAELSGLAHDFTRAIFELENNDSEKRIRYLGLALDSIKTYFSGKVAISEIPYKILKEHGFVEQDTAKSDTANLLKSVIGWDIGMTFTEVQPGLVKMGFRTRDAQKYDLSKIASILGGGGHKGAAGVSIKKPFEEAKKELFKKLSEVYPDLGKL